MSALVPGVLDPEAATRILCVVDPRLHTEVGVFFG
ncbi:hypothetical protein QFZ66_006335 [Streptomyces sp. B4I13]|nr:hypothetical protein [Streptomyces sp. B4I13]